MFNSINNSMKALKFIALAGAAAVALASCSQDVSVAVNEHNAISFRTSTGFLTKSVEATAANMAAFDVVAYHDVNATPTLFFDQEPGGILTVTNDNGTWTPAHVYYWPEQEDQISFFGYFPSGLANVATDGAKISFNDFSPANHATDQEDVMAAYAKQYKGQVAMNFQHALSEIVVRAKNNDTDNIKVEVLGVKIANVAGTGSFTYTPGADPLFSAPVTSNAGKDYAIMNAEEDALTLTGTATDSDIMFGRNGFIVLPQATTAYAETTNETGSYIALLVRMSKKENGEWSQYWPVSGGMFEWVMCPVGFDLAAGNKYVFTLGFYGENGGGGQVDPDPTDPDDPDVDPDLPDDTDPEDIPVDPEDNDDPDAEQLPITFTVTVSEWVEQNVDANMPAAN